MQGQLPLLPRLSRKSEIRKDAFDLNIQKEDCRYPSIKKRVSLPLKGFSINHFDRSA